MRRAIGSLILACTASAAQTTGPVQGPFLGYVFERGAGLRPVLGVAGASSLGAPLALGIDASTWVTFPSHDYAIAIDAGNRSAVLVELATAEIRAMGAAGACADQFVLSPSATSAAFYCVETGRIEVVSGLPGNPSLAGSAAMAEAPVAMAVSDDGGQILVARPGSAVRLNLTGDASHLVAGDIGAIAFAPRSLDVLVAERSARILLIRADGEQSVLFSADRESFGEVVAVAADRERAYLASASRVAVIPLNGEAAGTIECACTVTSLDRMNGDSVFRLTEAGPGPLWLLDKTRIVFVPAAGGVQ